MIHNILRSNLFRFNSKLNYFNPNLIKRAKANQFNQFNNTQVRKYSSYENYYRQHYSNWSNPDFIVKAIIGTNCGVFLYHSYLKLENDPRRVQRAMYDIYKHWTFSIANLKEGRWYTVITSHFTHGSILHLAFNCMTLYSFGPTVSFNCYCLVIITN
jgi:membrane associated rhomboid family serine protease